MKNIKKRLSLDKSGVVLMSVMIILLVMTIIIAGIVFMTVANLESSQKTSDHTETYYVAEGGINYLTKVVSTQYAGAPTTSQTAFFTNLDNFVATYPVSNKQVISFSTNGGKTSQALVWITPLTVSNPTVHSYVLNASGYIGSVYRTLKKQIDISYIGSGVMFNDAILSVGTMDLGGANITGTIQTSLNASSAITIGNGGTVSGIYIPTGASPTTEVTCSKAMTECIPGLGTSGIYQENPPTIKPIIVLDTPTDTTLLKPKTFTVSGKSYQLVNSSGDFLITSSTNLTVPTVYNIGDENPGVSTFHVPNFQVTQLASNFTLEVNRDITIWTDTLYLNNQLKVTGTGKLTIFVKAKDSSTSVNNQLQITASGIVGNQSDSTKMAIYVAAQTYKSGSTQVPALLSLGSGSYYFSLICANLNIDLGDSVLRGALATNALAKDAIVLGGKIGPANVFIGPSSASSAILLYAPNAIVAMKASSSSFYGAIVAGNFISSTGASHPTIVWVQAVNTYIPVDVIDLSGFNSTPTISMFKNPTIE